VVIVVVAGAIVGVIIRRRMRATVSDARGPGYDAEMSDGILESEGSCLTPAISGEAK
jgi:hypothetical protein